MDFGWIVAKNKNQKKRVLQIHLRLHSILEKIFSMRVGLLLYLFDVRKVELTVEVHDSSLWH